MAIKAKLNYDYVQYKILYNIHISQCRSKNTLKTKYYCNTTDTFDRLFLEIVLIFITTIWVEFVHNVLSTY